MATDAPASAPPRPRPRGRGGAQPGSDRWTVMLLTVAAVLVVVAVLAQQLPAGPPPGTRRVVLRKIYRTTVIETVRGSAGPSGTVVSQSVQSSGPSTAAAPATRTS